MIEEATVNCYNPEEQITGFYTMMADGLAVPFQTTVLGVQVTVEKIDLSDASDEILAICSRDGQRQAFPILDLPLPIPPPEGAEWIQAYRHWA